MCVQKNNIGGLGGGWEGGGICTVGQPVNGAASYRDRCRAPGHRLASASGSGSAASSCPPGPSQSSGTAQHNTIQYKHCCTTVNHQYIKKMHLYRQNFLTVTAIFIVTHL